MKLGYACINMQLSYPTKYGKPKGTKPITTGRGMIKRTFESKGDIKAAVFQSTLTVSRL